MENSHSNKELLEYALKTHEVLAAGGKRFLEPTDAKENLKISLEKAFPGPNGVDWSILKLINNTHFIQDWVTTNKGAHDGNFYSNPGDDDSGEINELDSNKLRKFLDNETGNIKLMLDGMKSANSKKEEEEERPKKEEVGGKSPPERNLGTPALPYASPAITPPAIAAEDEVLYELVVANKPQSKEFGTENRRGMFLTYISFIGRYSEPAFKNLVISLIQKSNKQALLLEPDFLRSLSDTGFPISPTKIRTTGSVKYTTGDDALARKVAKRTEEGRQSDTKTEKSSPFGTGGSKGDTKEVPTEEGGKSNISSGDGTEEPESSPKKEENKIPDGMEEDLARLVRDTYISTIPPKNNWSKYFDSEAIYYTYEFDGQVMSIRGTKYDGNNLDEDFMEQQTRQADFFQKVGKNTTNPSHEFGQKEVKGVLNAMTQELAKVDEARQLQVKILAIRASTDIITKEKAEENAKIYSDFQNLVAQLVFGGYISILTLIRVIDLPLIMSALIKRWPGAKTFDPILDTLHLDRARFYATKKEFEKINPSKKKRKEKTGNTRPAKREFVTLTAEHVGKLATEGTIVELTDEAKKKIKKLWENQSIKTAAYRGFNTPMSTLVINNQKLKVSWETKKLSQTQQRVTKKVEDNKAKEIKLTRIKRYYNQSIKHDYNYLTLLLTECAGGQTPRHANAVIKYLMEEEKWEPPKYSNAWWAGLKPKKKVEHLEKLVEDYQKAISENKGKTQAEIQSALRVYPKFPEFVTLLENEKHLLYGESTNLNELIRDKNFVEVLEEVKTLSKFLYPNWDTKMNAKTADWVKFCMMCGIVRNNTGSEVVERFMTSKMLFNNAIKETKHYKDFF